MSNLQAAAFQAFRSIGVAEDLALKAAEALSVRDGDVATLKTEFVLLKWMVGGLYFIALPGAWLLIRMAFKTGAIG